MIRSEHDCCGAGCTGRPLCKFPWRRTCSLASVGLVLHRWELVATTWVTLEERVTVTTRRSCWRLLPTIRCFSCVCAGENEMILWKSQQNAEHQAGQTTGPSHLVEGSSQEAVQGACDCEASSSSPYYTRCSCLTKKPQSARNRQKHTNQEKRKKERQSKKK